MLLRPRQIAFVDRAVAALRSRGHTSLTGAADAQIAVKRADSELAELAGVKAMIVEM